MHHQDVARAESLGNGRQRVLPLGREDAEQLPTCARRIGQRPQEVEDRSNAQLAPHRHGVAHGPVMPLREHEPHADFADAAGDVLRCEFEARTRRLEQIGAAALARGAAVAVLGDMSARRRDDERRRRRHVEAFRTAASARPADIDQVRHVHVDLGRHRAHRLRGTGDLVRRLALGLEANQDPGDLRRRHRASHDGVEHRTRLVALEIAARTQNRDGFSRRHASPPPDR